METSGPILVLDAAGSVGLVSLVKDEQTFEHRITAKMGQAGKLTEALTSVLSEANVNPTELKQVIACVGPGSFTGIRICLATALGLVSGLPKSVKISCVDAFDVQYQAFRRQHSNLESQDVLVLVDSKRPEIFSQLFTSARVKQGEPFLVQEADLPLESTSLITGDGLGCINSISGLTVAPIDLTTQDYLSAALRNHDLGIKVEARPFYLRPPDVGPQKK